MVPVVDGPGGFLPAMPGDIRESGEFFKGPIITGFNRNEGTLGLLLCEKLRYFYHCLAMSVALMNSKYVRRPSVVRSSVPYVETPNLNIWKKEGS